MWESFEYEAFPLCHCIFSELPAIHFLHFVYCLFIHASYSYYTFGRSILLATQHTLTILRSSNLLSSHTIHSRANAKLRNAIQVYSYTEFDSFMVTLFKSGKSQSFVFINAALHVAHTNRFIPHDGLAKWPPQPRTLLLDKIKYGLKPRMFAFQIKVPAALQRQPTNSLLFILNRKTALIHCVLCP